MKNLIGKCLWQRTPRLTMSDISQSVEGRCLKVKKLSWKILTLKINQQVDEGMY